LDNPKIPISWGELLDKITILEIKSENLVSKIALQNVEKEQQQLHTVLLKHAIDKKNIEMLFAELKQINKKLWDVEDSIREKERKKSFDEAFIQLARSVYIINDQRSRVKRNINDALGSDLIEEKSYSEY
jgi:hypothetical protein